MPRKQIFCLLIVVFFLLFSGLAQAGPDSYTKLLIHSNATEGSQSFTDSSDKSHIITANGQVSHSENEKVFGTTSIYFDGASDFLELSNDEDWHFGTQDFTIDFWYHPLKYDDLNEMLFEFGHRDVFQIYRARSGLRGGMIEARINGTIHTSSYKPDHIGTWKHFAFVRSGNSAHLFVNGEKLNTFTLSNNESIMPSDLKIGLDDNGNSSFYGYLDEFRVSKGIARWTENFDPPTLQYAGPTITLEPDVTTPVIGDSLCVDVNIADSTGLYSAAFDLTYNPAELQYQSSAEGNFFNADSGATFFEASLLNGNPSSGVLVMGVSRVADIGEISGSGTIATACFTVTGGSGSDITIGLDNGYFEGSVPGTGIGVAEGDDPVIPVEIGAPQNLTVTDPATLDRLDLSWDAAPDASGYEIYRSISSGGTFELLGTTTATTYQDNDCILTNVPYYYKVKAISSTGTSTGEFSNEATGSAAGIAGDINKDNRVDGRDLTILARAFNTDPGDPDYNCQANLDRTGSIDGDDLVELSSNFGDQL
ncbi:MAG: cohesin domain-containing protein [Desulfobacterales bacterium]|nr:cohesin domain-containing protein [Desulfobacterales bacterium]